MLSLRAGLGGPPRSRAQTARELGIGAGRERRLERRGLGRLRSACSGGGQAGGASGSPAAQALAARAAAMPRLQPAAMLTVATTSTPLVPADRLVARQEVKGAHASGGTAAASSSGGSGGGGGGTPALADATPTSSSTGIGAGVWAAIAAALVLMAALTTLAARGALGRRRTVAAPPDAAPHVEEWDWPARDAGIAAATAGAAVAGAGAVERDDPEPEAVPEEPAPVPVTRVRTTPAAEPVAPADMPASNAGRDYRRAARPAAMVVSGIVSLAAREIMRRRRGR